MQKHARVKYAAQLFSSNFMLFPPCYAWRALAFASLSSPRSFWPRFIKRRSTSLVYLPAAAPFVHEIGEYPARSLWRNDLTRPCCSATRRLPVYSRGSRLTDRHARRQLAL